MLNSFKIPRILLLSQPFIFQSAVYKPAVFISYKLLLNVVCVLSVIFSTERVKYTDRPILSLHKSAVYSLEISKSRILAAT